MAVNLKRIPTTPGVYKFFCKKEIIYIGKAKNLKKRVSSYFGSSYKDRKTSQIKFLTDHIETFTTKNEVEALLLEQTLIKENKPKFNILLRDDKTYPYIYFSLNHEFPGIYLKRTRKAVDANYFGPFVSSGAVKKSIKEIQKIFKIRNCNDSTFANRSRPCIEYQMKRCSAPCVNKVAKTDYFEDIQSAKSYLSSSDTQTINRLNKNIKRAANDLDFEKAAEIRDKLKRLKLLREEQSVVTKAVDLDIFAVAHKHAYIGISIIVVRNGKIRGTKTHLIKQALFSIKEEIYQSAILSFYDNQLNIPKKILCTDTLDSKELITEVIKKKFNKNTRITQSPTKTIRPIYNLCKLNAKQVIENHISKSDKYNFAFDQLKSLIGVNSLSLVEAYDVSHISGSHAVTSCVVFNSNGPKKKSYRSFNIPSDLAGNDTGSLKHTLERRMKRYGDENSIPDLILIDGGTNQLNVIQNLLSNSNYKNINVISIVKGKGRVKATETILSNKGILEIDNKSSAYLLLQEMRDEAHRFAIQAQRKKKQKTIKYSELDTIKGVGEKTKKILINEFKSLKKIKTLSLDEIKSVHGINQTTALSIYNAFNK
jgi:excinuclease ABC subunit C